MRKHNNNKYNTSESENSLSSEKWVDENKDSSNKKFNIEKHTNSNIVKLTDNVNIKTEDNVNLHKNNEKIKLSRKKNNSSNNRPNLTDDNINYEHKQKAKLVPMDGLDLLSNPKKIYNESSHSGSSSNSDSSISDFSLEDNNKYDVNDHYDNLFENNKTPPDDSSDDYDKRHSNNHHNYKKNNNKSYHKSNHDSSDSDNSSDSISVSSNSSSEYENNKKKTYDEIQKEKQILLFKLGRLENSMRIKLPRRFTMASNIEDIKYEYEKLKRQRDIDKSIKLQRKMLMATVSGFEFLNKKFDPIDAKLDGWSESIMENIDDYDEVFEELHDKYSEKMQVAPELKLLMMVGGSAFMFHLTNTLFKSNVPSLNEILKQNPDIMKNISQAAINSMNNNNNFNNNDPFMNMVKEGVNMKQQKYQNQNQNQNNMSGPTNIDDLYSHSGNMRHANSDNDIKHFSVNTKNKHNQRRDKKMGINIDV